MTVAQRRQAESLAAGAAVPFPARLLQPTIERLEQGERQVLLDLGRAQPGTLDFLSGFRCRLGIADVLEAIGELDPEQSAAALDRAFLRLLPEDTFGGADLILCWQLLDYIEYPVLEALGRRLCALLATGGRIHALTEYSASTMPDPMNPLFLDRDGAVRRAGVHAGGSRAAPRHAPAELQKRLGGLQIDRAVLLGNGMQEYLFSL